MTRAPHSPARVARFASLLLSVAVLAASGAAPAASMHLSAWGPAMNLGSVPGTSSELNTSALEGCPIPSPDGLSLYLASDREGGEGGLDIWVSNRPDTDAPWGAPVNVGEPINSDADDFCPTPVRGNGLFFVSTRTGGCGGADLYFARHNPKHGWGDPEHLPCAEDGGPNSTAGAAGPSYFEAGGREFLYFSSGSDIHVSERTGGVWGPAVPVAELNTSANDLRPNVRKDGLEIVFDSDRKGGFGGFDIYAATRSSVEDAWGSPQNLGPHVNTEHAETRAAFSWDARTLFFGSNRPGGTGSSDIYMTTRDKVPGAAGCRCPGGGGRADRPAHHPAGHLP
jgi:hypothetical protein